MFEFMHKYRVPILICIFMGLMGFGVWGAVQSLFGESANYVVGTFKVPGDDERRTVRWEDDFLPVLQWVKDDRSLGQQLFQRDRQSDHLITWNVIVLRAAAEQAGIVVSDAAVEDILTGWGAADPSQVPQSLWDWVRTRLMIGEYVQLYRSDPGGPSYEELLKEYRKEAGEIRVRYVTFERRSPDAFTLDPEDPEDKKKLADWWAENPGLKEEFAHPPKVTFEAAWVNFKEKRPQDPSDQESAEVGFPAWFEPYFGEIVEREDVTVDENEITLRYNAFKVLYDQKAEDIREEREEDDDEPKEEEPQDQPTRFELVKPWIEAELKAIKVVEKFMEEADEQPKDQSLEELAGRFGLKWGRKERVSASDFDKIPEFGNPRLRNPLFAPGESKPEEGEVIRWTNTRGQQFYDGVLENPTAFAVSIRVEKHVPRRPAELADPGIVEKAIERWQEAQAEEDLKERAEAFRDEVHRLAEGRIAEYAAKRREEAKDEAAKRIEELELDVNDPGDKVRIEEIGKLAESDAENDIEERRGEHEAWAFDEAVRLWKEDPEREIVVSESPWLSPAVFGAPQYPEDALPAEKRARLMRDPNRVRRLKTLEKGRMSDVDVDQQADMALVALVIDKREPDVVDMYEAEQDRTSTFNRLKFRLGSNPAARQAGFDFRSLRAPEAFDIQSEMADDIIKEQEETAARNARRSRPR